MITFSEISGVTALGGAIIIAVGGAAILSVVGLVTHKMSAGNQSPQQGITAACRFEICK